MAKRKVINSENYVKGVKGIKDVIIKFINSPDVELYLIKSGRYEDGKEFLTITIDNI